VCGALRRTAIETSAEPYDYIVIGSGAGGGPLAANLAMRGFRVLLIEAGSAPESHNYQVPCFHALSSEEKDMAWNFFVHHYDQNEQRDPKYREQPGGVLYPRAGTLGGCTAHNAMITIVPHDSDWNAIADLTGDESWRAEKMWKYFQRVERCFYREPPKPGQNDPSGHGYAGWLGTSRVDPAIGIADKQVVRTLLATARWGARRFWRRGLVRRIRHFRQTLDDPNDRRNRAAFEGMTTTIPLATVYGKRNGAREFIRVVQMKYPRRLTIRMNTLATRVIFENDGNGDRRAVAVECLEGKNLYRADPNATEAPSAEKKTYACCGEIILAGGAFNTPQLLMLSGIGPKEHLEKIGIDCIADRPGVGSRLQDRYEVGVVAEMEKPFAMLKHATFQSPDSGNPPDACFTDWLQGRGLYTSNGAMAALILRSNPAKEDPDLFLFALPGDFHGYFPGYSTEITKRKDHLTWAILKAHTNNTGGTVRLRSSNPRDTPVVRFHYFEEGTDTKGEDLAAVVEAVKLVRTMNECNPAIAREIIPGAEISDDRLPEWVGSHAWGHHASCSCRMGRPDDREAVVDSRFRVIGTKGLRIVDASVFPRIPGFFIVTPIYMISEKAADVIVEDAPKMGCRPYRPSIS
jgi:choline dehydrogenase